MAYLTITQYVNNVSAHQKAGWWDGKIQYKGKAYTHTEFDEAFPVVSEKLISEREFLKGANNDKTKMPKI